MDGPASARAAVKVSVVVPVYNPGGYIEPLITSLLEQTLSSDEFEAIFVDDGSTDATPERLDALAASHEHLRVIHQPNSGWPGKPRNVGIDAARGEYIQFVDHDDLLTTDALEKLYDRAVHTSSDVVIGKVVSRGRGSRIGGVRRREDRATLATNALEGTLTPHKLFRTAMLREHQIRFPEGKRRLEDHAFVMHCYFAAQNVAILADHPCYIFTRRSDGKNSAHTRIDPREFYGNVRETIDIVEANTEPGPFRDRILRRFYSVEILKRLQEPRILRWPSELREELFEQVKTLTDERFPESVPDGLPLVSRLRSVLLRRGDLQGLVTFAERCSQVQVQAELRRATWSDDGRLRIDFTVALRYRDGTLLRLVAEAGGYRLDPRLTDGLFGRDTSRVGPAQTVGDLLRVDFTLRERSSSLEWWVPCTTSPRLIPVADDSGAVAGALEFGCTADLDPSTAAAGQPLANGAWDLWLATSLGGLRRNLALGVATGDDVELPRRKVFDEPPRLARPRLVKGKLSLKIRSRRLSGVPAGRARSNKHRSRVHATTPGSWARRSGDRLHVELSVRGRSKPLTDGAQLRLKRGSRTVEADAEFRPDDDHAAPTLRADVPIGALRPGVWKLSVRPARGGSYKRLDARLLLHRRNPVAVLVGPTPPTGDIPHRQAGTVPRHVARSLGRAADAVTQELSPDRAARYRETVRRVGRKLVP